MIIELQKCPENQPGCRCPRFSPQMRKRLHKAKDWRSEMGLSDEDWAWE